MHAWITLVWLALLSQQSLSLIHSKKFTSLCSKNVTLSKPNESLQIDFSVEGKNEWHNCTSYVMWTGRTDHRLIPYVTKLASSVDSEADQLVLNITDIGGVLLKLDMLGSKPFYLTITPAKMVNDGKSCPASYFWCGYQACIHRQLVCDGVVQCAADEAGCFQEPSNYFLVLSLLGVMFSMVFVSFIMALSIYFKFYRNTVYLLSSDLKPKLYGTVNGSHTSFITVPPQKKKSHFYQNIHHYNQFINNNLK